MMGHVIGSTDSLTHYSCVPQDFLFVMLPCRREA